MPLLSPKRKYSSAATSIVLRNLPFNIIRLQNHTRCFCLTFRPFEFHPFSSTLHPNEKIVVSICRDRSGERLVSSPRCSQNSHSHPGRCAKPIVLLPSLEVRAQPTPSDQQISLQVTTVRVCQIRYGKGGTAAAHDDQITSRRPLNSEFQPLEPFQYWMLLQ